jgi:hypothetical protein
MNWIGSLVPSSYAIRALFEGKSSTFLLTLWALGLLAKGTIRVGHKPV